MSNKPSPKFKPIQGTVDDEEMTVTFRATAEYVLKLDQAARKNKLSRARLVRQCVDFALSQIEEQDNDLADNMASDDAANDK